jgi:hypothetical protein
MTLMWVFQLCDELPMIGFSSFLAWSVFNIEPGYANTAFSMASLAAVFLADLAMAITYVRPLLAFTRDLAARLTDRGPSVGPESEAAAASGRLWPHHAHPRRSDVVAHQASPARARA